MAMIPPQHKTAWAFRPASDAPVTADRSGKAFQGLNDWSSEIIPSSQARKQ
jgi:hypothetical protein